MRKKESKGNLGQTQIGRLVSLFLVLAMLLGILPISAFAAQGISNSSGWDGTTKTEVAPNEEGVYEISTAAELAWFAEKVNGGEYNSTSFCRAVLMNDIDLGGKEWTPIGKYAEKSTKRYNNIIFDGNNHRISNLYISEENFTTLNVKDSIDVGLFGYIKGKNSASIIKNLTVSGKIEINNYSDEKVTLSIGGIAGKMSGQILNCKNEVTISASNCKVKEAYIGGICGWYSLAGKPGYLVGCSNTGNISFAATDSSVAATLGIAGIAGTLFGNGNCIIESSYNLGNVSVDYSAVTAESCKVYYGGIANNTIDYEDNRVLINNCFNIGQISRQFPEQNSYTLCGGGIGSFGGINKTYYPTNCSYLSTASSGTGLCDTEGQTIADATDGISAKTESELKSTDFVNSLNTANYLSDYVVSWNAGEDGYPAISSIQAAVGIKSFTVAGVTATIDQTAHTITAELPAGTDLTKQKPTIECFAGATSDPASGVEQNFTNPVTYKVGDITYTVTLTVKQPPFVGEGTAESPYLIDSAERLLKLSTEYNKAPENWSNKHWKQTAELDMTGIEFIPIGVSTAFSGTYDGGNFAIKNLSISPDALYIGLFGIIGNGATIKNVVLDTTCSVSASKDQCRVGGIAGQMNASGVNTIENCVNRASVTGAAPNAFNALASYAGGIVGEILGSKTNTVLNCKNYGTVKQATAAAYYAGGIAGIQLGNSVIAGCENHGIVTALSAETWSGLGNGSTVGGIAASSFGYISGCYNDGAVSAGRYVGGIVGRGVQDSVVESCYNAGSVTGNSAEATDCGIGGIVGSCSSTVLTKCYNVGTCTAHAESSSTKLGSIVGSCKRPTELSGNYFLGTDLTQGYGEYTTGQTPTTVMMMPVTEDWLKSSSVVTLLNDYAEPYSLYKAVWATGDSYPVLNKVEKIQSHYAEIKTFTVVIGSTTYTGTISGTDISIVLPAGTTSIIPTITISDKATVNPASGASASLTDGTATFTVTAENGKKVTYTLHATIPSEAGGLAALEVYTPQDVFFPASGFAQSTKTYTATVNDTKIISSLSGVSTKYLYFKVIPATAGVTMTAKLNDGDPITLTALTSMSGSESSGSIPLWNNTDTSKRPIQIGENTITITVTPAGGSESDATVYTLTLNVTPTLKSLSFSGNEQELALNETFDAEKLSYTLDIPDDVTELTISAVARMTDKATVTLPQGATEDGKLDISELRELAVKVGSGDTQTTYTITLNKRETYSAKIVSDPVGAAISVKPASGDAVTPDASGNYKLLAGETYTVKATKPGYVTATATISSASDLTNGTLTIRLTPVNNPLPDYDGDWTSFRGSDSNMAIVNAPTPINASEAAELWVTDGTGSYTSSVTQPLIINGYLYVQSGKKVLKIDPATGTVTAEGTLTGSSRFTTNPLGYGDGMIFAAIDDLSTESGYIQALNAETLQSLWISEPISGQMISPITYHNGYVYTGTWNSETDTGTYFALPVTDQNTGSTNETQETVWRITHKGGFYWAGAYATDQYVVFGSDDGSAEGSSSSGAVLYSVNPLTGRTISTLTGITGDIRSTVAYDDGYVYFTTKGGYLYQAKVSSSGVLSDLKSFNMGYMATGTPVVYGNVAFVTCSGAEQFNSTGTVYAVDVTTMQEISKATTPAYVQASMLLSTAYESSGKLYLYAANNGVDGTISVIVYDKSGKTLTCSDLYTPTPANPSQPNEYCLCAPICDANGTLYFKNDSGRLFAVKSATSGYAITVLTTENGTVSADKQRASAGTTVTVTVTPSLGYQIKSLTMNDTPLTVTDGTATFLMPDRVAILDAEFEKSSSAVDELRQAMQDLVITNASKSTYDAIEEIKAARSKLTAAEKAEIEDDYKAFLKKAEAFDTYLDEAKQTAAKEINDYVNGLDKKKYSDKNWLKVTDLQSAAIRNINKALYTDAIDQIVETALDEIKAIKAGEITVTFRLIGALEATQDVNLTSDSYLPEYVTWIPTTTYSLDAGAMVYDVFMEAIKDAGLTQLGADSNYVRTIYAPSCLGGYALSEFTNGKRSGWMYTVNGSHPNQGLKNWELKDGDVVIWHYINDYAHECADWFNDPQYPALGNGTYYNGWLRAADITPERYVEQLLGKILTVGKHGSVEPTLKITDIGKSVTFTFKPDTGYKVKDVKVDGKSVGAVTTYTVSKLTVSTRIEVEFTDAKLPFTDVLSSDWFYDDVAFVYNEGLFAGTSSTTFSPNAAMTRAMLVTVLYRLEGEPTVSGRSGFADVVLNSYYEDAVTWAADNGIVNGTSDTTFSPEANVTREQMAAILYRYAQYKKYATSASSSLTGFSDHASVSSYAVTSLQWAVAEKLVNGTAGKLMPTGNATRAQVAAILHRFVENVVATK